MAKNTDGVRDKQASRQVTLDEVKKMSDEEIRRRLAGLNGWEVTVDEDVAFQIIHSDGRGCGGPRDKKNAVMEAAGVPDYPRDLNAAIEAVKFAGQDLLDADQWERFGRALLESHPTATLDDIDGIDFYDLATFVSDLSARTICETLVLCLSPDVKAPTLSQENQNNPV